MYTTIIHPLRKALCLSVNEYVLLDTVYHLSNNEKYGGWCIISKNKMADWLDISVETVYRMLKTLEEKELIKRDEATKYIKTTDSYNELIANKEDWLIGFKGKESAFLSGKMKIDCQKDSDTVNLQKDTVKMTVESTVKMTDNIYKEDNNKYNRAVFDKLKKWLSSMSDVSSPEGLAKKYFETYPEERIAKALKNPQCTTRHKFSELCGGDSKTNEPLWQEPL